MAPSAPEARDASPGTNSTIPDRDARLPRTIRTPCSSVPTFCSSISTRPGWRGRLSLEGSRGPHPLADLGRVLQVLPGVGRSPGDRSLQLGDQGRGAVLCPISRIDALQGVHRQVVAAHAVQDNHVEGGRRGALLREAPNVEAVDVDVPVDDLVYRAPVAVEGEDDLLIGGEELDEARLAHAVRVKLAGEERHQVYDVDDADLELWSVLAQPVRRSDGLQGRDVAGAGQHDVGLIAFGYIARPLPNGGAAGGVLYGRVHIEPLELGLLVYGDEVDVVAATEAVVGDREEGVGVGGQVDAGYSAPLREHHVDEARPLVGEAVVVVAPGGRGQEDVERSDGLPPGEVDGLLQPLGVLHYHRGGDHRERLVGGEEAVAAGEQVALEPALTEVFAQDLEDPPRGRDVVVDRERLADEAAVLDLEDGAEPIGVGLVRAEEPEVSRIGVACEGIAEHLTQASGGLVVLLRWRRHLDGVAAEVGQVEVLQHPAAVGVGACAHAFLPLRRERGQLGDQLSPAVEELLGAVGAHPLLQEPELFGVRPHARERHLVGAERTGDGQAVYLARPGPALRSAEHDRRPAGAPRAARVPFARLALYGPDLVVAPIQRSGERLVDMGRVVPLDEVDGVTVSFEYGAHLFV